MCVILFQLGVLGAVILFAFNMPLPSINQSLPPLCRQFGNHINPHHGLLHKHWHSPVPSPHDCGLAALGGWLRP